MEERRGESSDCEGISLVFSPCLIGKTRGERDDNNVDSWLQGGKSDDEKVGFCDIIARPC